MATVRRISQIYCIYTFTMPLTTQVPTILFLSFVAGVCMFFITTPIHVHSSGCEQNWYCSLGETVVDNNFCADNTADNFIACEYGCDPGSTTCRTAPRTPGCSQVNCSKWGACTTGLFVGDSLHRQRICTCATGCTCALPKDTIGTNWVESDYEFCATNSEPRNTNFSCEHFLPPTGPQSDPDLLKTYWVQGPDLRHGDYDWRICNLQHYLNKKSYRVTPKGAEETMTFTLGTREALKFFQRGQGIRQTGVFDKKTQDTILKKKAPLPAPEKAVAVVFLQENNTYQVRFVWTTILEKDTLGNTVYADTDYYIFSHHKDKDCRDSPITEIITHGTYKYLLTGIVHDQYVSTAKISPGTTLAFRVRAVSNGIKGKNTACATYTFPEKREPLEPQQPQALAQQVFTKYTVVFQREDIRKNIPEILKWLEFLKEPEMQRIITPEIIDLVVESPDLLIQYANRPEVNQRSPFIALLKTDRALQNMFKDTLVQTLLQNPPAIDALIVLLQKDSTDIRTLAQQVFTKYTVVFQREDIRKNIPEILKWLEFLKEPEMQRIITPEIIDLVVESPDLLIQYANRPEVNQRSPFIALLKTDRALQNMFKDTLVQTLLQNPPAIDALIVLLQKDSTDIRTLAQQVFTKYTVVFQREDIRKNIPEILKWLEFLKEPEMQRIITPEIIDLVVESPDLLIQYANRPEVNQRSPFIALLKTDRALQNMFKDTLVQTLLQNPPAIDALIVLLQKDSTDIRTLAQQVFTKYTVVFQREDIRKNIPEILKWLEFLKEPEMQRIITPEIIDLVVESPDLLIQYANRPEVNQRSPFIALLKTDRALQNMFKDTLVQTLLQNPPAIDALIVLLQKDSVTTADTTPPIITLLSSNPPSFTITSSEAGDLTDTCTNKPPTPIAKGDTTLNFISLSDGTYTCTIAITDTEGNKGTYALPVFTIDTTVSLSVPKNTQATVTRKNNSINIVVEWDANPLVSPSSEYVYEIERHKGDSCTEEEWLGLGGPEEKKARTAEYTFTENPENLPLSYQVRIIKPRLTGLLGNAEESPYSECVAVNANDIPEPEDTTPPTESEKDIEDSDTLKPVAVTTQKDSVTTADTTPPIITLLSSNPPSFTITSSEAGDLTDTCTNKPPTPIAKGDTTLNFISLSDGTYTCTIAITDTEGNKGTYALPVFTIDTTVSLSVPKNTQATVTRKNNSINIVVEWDANPLVSPSSEYVYEIERHKGDSCTEEEWLGLGGPEEKKARTAEYTFTENPENLPLSYQVRIIKPRLTGLLGNAEESPYSECVAVNANDIPEPEDTTPPTESEKDIEDSDTLKPVAVTTEESGAGGTVLVLVHEDVYNDLTEELQVWSEDISREQGLFSDARKVTRNQTVAELKNIIQETYENLDDKFIGVLLIGDIPVSITSGIPDDRESYGSGTDYWVARLTPKSSTVSDVTLLKNYFKRNHDYRTGKISFEGKPVIYLPMTDLTTGKLRHPLPIAQWGGYSFDIEDLLQFFTFPNNLPLDNNSEYFHWLSKKPRVVGYNGHGSPTAQEHGIDSRTVRMKEISFLFAGFLSCSVGRFTVHNYLAGQYLFGNGRDYTHGGLIVAASPWDIFSGGFTDTGEAYELLFLGIGQEEPVYEELFSDPASLGIFRGLHIFGDPTLKVSYQ